jgi:hypothetical protein
LVQKKEKMRKPINSLKKILRERMHNTGISLGGKIMNRRKALKIFGAIFVCLAGRPVARAGDRLGLNHDLSKPTDYVFCEQGIGNIIIERRNGAKIVIPFSEIVEALGE